MENYILRKKMNLELNKLSIYKNKVCVDCGRSYPETTLNIEGVIHHGNDYNCLNRKACGKKKKLASKKKKSRL